MILELGAGPVREYCGSVTVDILHSSGADVVMDALEYLKLLDKGTVSGIYCRHFLSHVPSLVDYMREFERVLGPGGWLRIISPHFSNPYYYSDPTHVTRFGLYTLSYFCSNSYFRRLVPTYGHRLDFDIEAVILIFKCGRPFYISYGAMKLVGLFFGKSRFMQEFYEFWMSGVLPCYEIEYQLIRTKNEESI